MRDLLKKMVWGAVLLPVLMTGAAHACACCTSYIVVNVSDGDVLNIRKGASSRSTKVGAIPADHCGIRRLGPRRGRWVKIKYDRTVGWVHSRYIRWIP